MQDIKMKLGIAKVVDTLNKYQQVAYDGGCGTDYLSELGEGIRYYFMECDNNNIEPTIENFLEWIDSINPLI